METPLAPFRVFGSRVLLRKLPAPEFSEGGLAMPANMRVPGDVAVVLGVGEGYGFEDHVVPLQCQPGDQVLVHPHRGEIARWGGEDLWVVEERHVFGIFRDTAGA